MTIKCEAGSQQRAAWDAWWAHAVKPAVSRGADYTAVADQLWAAYVATAVAGNSSPERGSKPCSKCSEHRYSVDPAFGCRRWEALQLVGVQKFDHGEALELRNCPCGSTLAWPIDYPAAREGRTVYLHVDFQPAEAA